MKRIGAFLSRHTIDPLQKEWETWVSKNRDLFAPLAMPILTSALLLAAALLLWAGNGAGTAGFWIWLVLMAAFACGSISVSRDARRRRPLRQRRVPGGMPHVAE